MDTTLEKTKDAEVEKALARKIEIITAHFEKKSEKMRALLEAYPVPEKLLKK
ncbi:hypothetical protein [Dyadobacter sp. CY347]|uniref:hypothetical protein n=1 Tax=Dyadobacter sp. CY347 TaxID=2909336 RepID=UPI001F1FAC86|nr:hypothetical protein [Dyadobacter sp. CY347]MCF2488728.1 hypothetical protein [Dyadobacter sp. CY347]